jgi:hypothetical protein
MMTIIVEDGSEFQMHRGLLCFYSEYFRKLLDGPFKEGGSNSHTLSEVSRDTFNMFYSWVYTSVVADSDGTADADLDYDMVISLYAFADFHIVPDLKNRALELFWLHLLRSWVAPTTVTPHLYRDTPEGSFLRKLHVDLMLETHRFETWRASENHTPKAYISDLFDTCRKNSVIPGSCFGICGPGKSIDAWVKAKQQEFCATYHEHRSKSDTDTKSS